MHVVPHPESYDAIEVTDSITGEDLQAFYHEVNPDGTATIAVMKMGKNLLVTTTDSPDWVGQFVPGDLLVFSSPIFTRLGDAKDYVPYDSVYVS